MDPAAEKTEADPAAPSAWRRARVAIVVAVLLLPAAVALVVKVWQSFGPSPGRAEQAFGVIRTDMPAPPFRHQTADGGTFALSDARGQLVFLNFWATWCPPCRDEMPSMLRLGRELEARHPGKFRMVAVSVDDGWEVIRDFFGGAAPGGLTVTLDTDQLTTRAYYCSARGSCPESFKFPETYIVDPAGRLVAYVVGPRDWSDPAARAFLERLIGG